MAAWLTDEARRLPTGNIIVTYDYDAFGNSVSTSGNTPNEFLYRGEMYDSDLGLYYLRARYMNPLTGRFMSRDPKPGSLVDPKTLHNYLYADGDPVNAIDPSGRGALSEYADSILLIAAYLTQVPAQTYWNAAHAVCDAYETLDLFETQNRNDISLDWRSAGGTRCRRCRRTAPRELLQGCRMK